MSDAETPAAVAGLAIDAVGDQLQGIQDALEVLTEAGIDVSDVSVAVEGGALAATVTFDGARLAEADLSGPVVETEVVDEPDEATDDGGASEAIIEEPATAADHRLAIASLVGLDDYLDYDGDKPPQFSKGKRVTIATDATSLEADQLADRPLDEQVELAVVAHGFDSDTASRQYYRKPELEKIYRQLTGEATAPGVPEEYVLTTADGGTPRDVSETAVEGVDDGGESVDDADEAVLDGLELPKHVTVDAVEEAATGADTPTEAARELRISRAKAVSLIKRLGLEDEVEVNDEQRFEDARQALESNQEPEWVETDGPVDADADGPSWTEFATNGGDA